MKTLIPPEIKELYNHKKADVILKLASVSAKTNWPLVCVSINNNVIFNDLVINEAEITSTTVDPIQSEFFLSIKFCNKTDNDVVCVDNKIVENMSLTISSMIINGVEMLKNGVLFNFGSYNMDIDHEKEKLFHSLNIPTRNSHSLSMTENGEWEVRIQYPILSSICQLVSSPGSDESVFNRTYSEGIVGRILQLLDEIEKLESCPKQ